MNPIILEGPDGSGKTRLAEMLRDAQGYAYVHFDPPGKRKDLFSWYLDPLVERDGRPAVFDRLHLSERIYGPVMRGKSLMTDLQERLIERWVEARDGQVVICLPPWEVVRDNWRKSRGAQYVATEDQLRKIYSGYADLLFDRHRNRNYVRYDYTRRRATEFATALCLQRGYPLPTGVVGSQRPRFLFVGEKAGPGHGAKRRDLTFLTTRDSSGWLNACLDEAGYEERELAFVNALNLDGTPRLLEVIIGQIEINRPEEPLTIVALGKVADRRLLSVGHHVLEHPQYAKRFKSKERLKYVAALRRIRRLAS